MASGCHTGLNALTLYSPLRQRLPIRWPRSPRGRDRRVCSQEAVEQFAAVSVHARQVAYQVLDAMRV